MADENGHYEYSEEEVKDLELMNECAELWRQLKGRPAALIMLKPLMKELVDG